MTLVFFTFRQLSDVLVLCHLMGLLRRWLAFLDRLLARQWLAFRLTCVDLVADFLQLGRCDGLRLVATLGLHDVEQLLLAAGLLAEHAHLLAGDGFGLEGLRSLRLGVASGIHGLVHLVLSGGEFLLGLGSLVLPVRRERLVVQFHQLRGCGLDPAFCSRRIVGPIAGVRRGGGVGVLSVLPDRVFQLGLNVFLHTTGRRIFDPEMLAEPRHLVGTQPLGDSVSALDRRCVYPAALLGVCDCVIQPVGVSRHMVVGVVVNFEIALSFWRVLVQWDVLVAWLRLHQRRVLLGEVGGERLRCLLGLLIGHRLRAGLARLRRLVIVLAHLAVELRCCGSLVVPFALGQSHVARDRLQRRLRVVRLFGNLLGAAHVVGGRGFPPVDVVPLESPNVVEFTPHPVIVVVALLGRDLSAFGATIPVPHQVRALSIRQRQIPQRRLARIIHDLAKRPLLLSIALFLVGVFVIPF